MTKKQNMKNARILLVEDDVLNQEVMGAMLRMLGYRTDIATDGAEALQALSSNDYQLILMDCKMPVMDGFEAVNTIRNSAEAWKRIPVIAITANALSGERERCMNAGMDEYLSKPVKMEDLGKMLERFISDDAMGDG